MKKLINNMKISEKLCALYIVILLLSLVLISSVDRRIYRTDMENSASTIFGQISDTVELIMEDVSVTLNAFTKAPLYSKQIQQELAQDALFSQDSVWALNYSTEIISASDRPKYIVALYSLNGRIAYYSATNKNAEVLRENADRWIEEATAAHGRYCLLALPEEEDYSCTALRLIRSTTDFKDLGVSSICISSSIFEEKCSNIKSIPGGKILITDSAGDAIFSSEPGLAYMSVPQELRYEAEAGHHTGELFRNEKYLAYFHDNDSSGYHVLIYTDLDSLMSSQRQSGHIMIACAFLIFVFATGATILIVRGTTKPLKKITELMDRYRAGDHTVRFHVRYNDEIGMLGQSFNAMLDRIDEMTEHIVRVSTQKKQIEIDALKSQIDPHFTYNTLEKFRMMAVDKDDFDFADKIAAFGKMLRYSVTTINEMTTVGREIDFLKNYILVVNNGNRNTITLITEADEEVLDAELIKLLLQPVIENSIYHGFENNCCSSPVITLRISRQGDELFFVVSDNGKGMTEQVLDELRRSIGLSYEEAVDSRHIGLRNVNARMKLFYGPEYGLKIESSDGAGTSVSFSIPYNSKRKD